MLNVAIAAVREDHCVALTIVEDGRELSPARVEHSANSREREVCHAKRVLPRTPHKALDAHKTELAGAQQRHSLTPVRDDSSGVPQERRVGGVVAHVFVAVLLE